MDLLSTVTFILSMLYLWLAIKNNYWCFVVAIFQCSLWAYLDFAVYKLVFDGILQLFYIGMAIWGIYLWSSKMNGNNRPIIKISIRRHFYFVGGGLLLAVILAFVSEWIISANYRFLDALTTVFSIGATFLLVYRVLENWWYFVIADALYVYIYFQSGSKMLALTMIIYTIVAIYGYFQWLSIKKNQALSDNH